MESFADAITLYRSGRTQAAESACEALLTRANDDVNALTLLADIQLSTGKPAAAISTLNALARLRPRDAANHRRLGGALLSLARAGEAVDVLRRAIALEPDSFRAHNNLGHALLQTGNAAAAIRHLERAVELNPDYAIGYNNLGLALKGCSRLIQAVAAFERAVALDASLIVASINLAVAFEDLGRLPQAIEVYDRILALDPSVADALSGRGALQAKLGHTRAALQSLDAALKLRPDDARTFAHKASVLLGLERASEALWCAQQALRLDANYVEALNLLAGALCKLHRPADARVTIERALELDVGYVEGWCTSALVHQNLGDHRSAADAYRRALTLDPGCMAARTGLICASIAAVPDSTAEDTTSRTGFAAELAAFEAWLAGRELNGQDTWSLAKQQFFYLSYQEEPNKVLLQRYRGESSRRLAPIADASAGMGAAASASGGGRAPEYSTARSGRFRLGIVSAQVFDHSVFSALVQGWLQHLDRENFDITVFSVGGKPDSVTAAAAAVADHFEDDSRSAENWARLIDRRGLDAVIYPEVGMDQTTLALAGLRLAPRQFAAWGHPETTGLPTIDYYLSAAAFEPTGAQDHYVEQLIRLPNLGVYYQPYAVDPVEVDFEEWGIRAHGPVFVCPGTPFKYRPHDDVLLIDIARRLGRCEFIFFNHEKGEFSKRLHARLTAAFAQAGLDPGCHLKWIPWLPRPAFLGLLSQADVYLDTTGFSGFNTMMQAVQAHLPAVAYEGQFMRGRLGSGILRRLGLDELVAPSRADYVDIAVRLGQNRAWRGELRSKLRLAEHRAYADAQAVDALAKVLLESRTY